MRDSNPWMGFFAASVFLLLAASAWPEDWPQWRGLNRDGLSRETGLLKEWPKEGPKLLWQVNELGSGYATPSVSGGAVLVGDFLYGSGQTLMCVEYKTGQIKWNERSIAPASLCYAEGLLYMHGEGGDMALIEATPESYRERGRFTPPNQPLHNNPMEKAWAYPVVTNGRLYIRDLDTMWCYDIQAPKQPSLSLDGIVAAFFIPLRPSPAEKAGDGIK
jgi:hypothetical protein